MKTSFKRLTALIVTTLILLSTFSLNGVNYLGFKADALSIIEPIIVEEYVEVSLRSVGSNNAKSSAVYSECYGNQLDSISKKIYDAFVDYYAKKRNVGDFSEPLDIGYSFTTTVSGNQIVINEAYENLVKKVQRDLQGAVSAFLYDYPEVYWFRSMNMQFAIQATERLSGNRIGCELTNFVFSPIQIYSGASSKVKSFDSAVQQTFLQIKSEITEDTSRKSLLKLIHDYICDKAYYNYSGAFVDLKVHSPEPIFIGNGGVVCEGYAKSFKILCDKFDIPCALITGFGSNGDVSEGHMWNYVMMDDSKWYMVDATWDDQEYKVEYTYFIASAYSEGFHDTVANEHVENGDFGGDGLVYFTYPVLSNTEYEECKHIWNDYYTIDKEVSCTQDGVKSIHCKLCSSVKGEIVTKAKGHSYETVTTIATLKKAGKKVTKCTVCDNISSTKTLYIPSKFTVSPKDSTYNGKVKTIAVKVQDSKSNTLKNDRDYTVKYNTDRKSVGKHSISITFKGDYSGSKTVYYYILPSKTSKITFSQTATSLKASWSKVTGATGYKVQLLSSKGTTLSTKYTTSLYYRFSNLKSGTEYKVKVTAYKIIDGEKRYSLSYKTLSSATKPAKPTLKVTASTKKAKLSWSKKTGTGYEILYSTKSNFKSAKKVTVSGYKTTSKTISKLTKGKKYYFKIRAYKTVDGKKIYSDYSSVKSAKIK